MVLSKQINTKSELKNSIISCENHFRNLSEVSFNREDILTWFQGLCRHLTSIIEQINNYCKIIKEKSPNFIPDTLFLYLTQIITTLSLLINIFVCEEEKKLILTEARKCFIKQLTCCIESIEVALNSEKSLIEPSGNFVKWMDVALQKITEINIQDSTNHMMDIYDQTRQLFEEVLSHAMSIAQVSLPEDSKIIRGSCQIVLTTLHSLNNEINNTTINGAMVNLFINASRDKLCSLEKKVNTSVLKLCLKTFAQLYQPLEKIHKFCLDQNNRNKMNELDSLVADFDLHVDRIMQIGLFAISCSSDLNRGIKIRSCLASLEALESELVPALASALLDNNKHNHNCAEIFINHWKNQANCLQNLIFLIIDPFAFCQIIYEEASNIVDNLAVDNFISVVKVLQTFLEKAHTEFTPNEASKIKTKIKDFNEVLEEVECASKLENNSKRVIKRCKIMLTVIKRIWVCFADDNSTNNKSLIESKSDVQIKPTGNVFLDHIINRGKQILEDRSVLYKTPIKNSVCIPKNRFLEKNGLKGLPLSKLVHLRKLSFVNNSTNKESTLDLQITDILNEMTNLSTCLKPH